MQALSSLAHAFFAVVLRLQVPVLGPVPQQSDVPLGRHVMVGAAPVAVGRAVARKNLQFLSVIRAEGKLLEPDV